MVRVDNLTVRYRGSSGFALRDVSLRIDKGKVVLVCGATGCGKTTLLRTLAGLLLPEHVEQMSGSSEVAGFPAPEINHSEGAPTVGVLFQNPDDQIIGRTPAEEVGFGLENLNLPIEQFRTRIEEALRAVSILELSESDVSSLSGGQKQKVSIAAVLALEPELILLDEPTSNLDGNGRAQVLRTIRDLKEQDRTVIIASHDVRDIAPLCDRIVVLRDGEIAADADYGTLFRREDPLDVLGIRQRNSKELRRKPMSPDTSDTLVLARNLAFSYRSNGFTLKPFNLEVRLGERIALFGPNGGGKTTLLSLLAGILKPQSGELLFKGIPFGRLKGPKRAALLAYVTQNPDLMLHRPTVSEEIAARPRYLRMGKKHKEISVEQSLRDYDLTIFKERNPFALSQGQRQRLALAASHTGGAKLLLVDEPTTGQDWVQTRSLLNHLSLIARNDGLAVIFSTHNLEAALEAADRALVVVDGELIFDGHISNLFANEALLKSAGLIIPEGLKTEVDRNSGAIETINEKPPYTGENQ